MLQENVIISGYLDIKAPMGSPERKSWKTWQRCWTAAVAHTASSLEPALELLLSQNEEAPPTSGRDLRFPGRDLRLFRGRSRSRPLRTWGLASSDGSVKLYLAARTEAETQLWMQRIRDAMWPPEIAAQIRAVTRNAHNVSLLDDERSSRSGLIGAYGQIVLTSDNALTLIHPHWGATLLRCFLSDVKEVRLLRNVKSEHPGSGVFIMNIDSVQGKKGFTFYSQTANEAVNWIVAECNSVKRCHHSFRDEDSKFGKMLHLTDTKLESSNGDDVAKFIDSIRIEQAIDSKEEGCSAKMQGNSFNTEESELDVRRFNFPENSIDLKHGSGSPNDKNNFEYGFEIYDVPRIRHVKEFYPCIAEERNVVSYKSIFSDNIKFDEAICASILETRDFHNSDTKSMELLGLKHPSEFLAKDKQMHGSDQDKKTDCKSTDFVESHYRTISKSPEDTFRFEFDGFETYDVPPVREALVNKFQNSETLYRSVRKTDKTIFAQPQIRGISSSAFKDRTSSHMIVEDDIDVSDEINDIVPALENGRYLVGESKDRYAKIVNKSTTKNCKGDNDKINKILPISKIINGDNLSVSNSENTILETDFTDPFVQETVYGSSSSSNGSNQWNDSDPEEHLYESIGDTDMRRPSVDSEIYAEIPARSRPSFGAQTVYEEIEDSDEDFAGHFFGSFEETPPLPSRQTLHTKSEPVAVASDAANRMQPETRPRTSSTVRLQKLSEKMEEVLKQMEAETNSQKVGTTNMTSTTRRIRIPFGMKRFHAAIPKNIASSL